MQKVFVFGGNTCKMNASVYTVLDNISTKATLSQMYDFWDAAFTIHHVKIL